MGWFKGKKSTESQNASEEAGGTGITEQSPSKKIKRRSIFTNKKSDNLQALDPTNINQEVDDLELRVEADSSASNTSLTRSLDSSLPPPPVPSPAAEQQVTQNSIDMPGGEIVWIKSTDTPEGSPLVKEPPSASGDDEIAAGDDDGSAGEIDRASGDYHSNGKATTITQAPSVIEPVERHDLVECTDVAVLLCRLVHLRMSIAKFYLEESQHYQKRKSKVAELFKKCIHLEGDKRDAAIKKISAVMHQGLIGMKTSNQLNEDIKQVADLEKQIAKLKSAGNALPNLTDYEERLILVEHAKDMRFDMRELQIETEELRFSRRNNRAPAKELKGILRNPDDQ